MSVPVFVGSAFVAQYPTGGGNCWVPLQYLLGLRAAGADAYWLELLWTRGDPARVREFIEAFRRHVGRAEYCGMAAAELAARARDALLLNLAASVTLPLRVGFARTALFDLDPGPF